MSLVDHRLQGVGVELHGGDFATLLAEDGDSEFLIGSRPGLTKILYFAEFLTPLSLRWLEGP